MPFAAMARPVPTDPVKLIAVTSGWLTITSPTTEPRPMTRLNTPAGNPARARISAIAHAHPGTRSAGLHTTVLPYASAGAIFHAGIAIGKFHGVMSPMTPSGSRVTSTSTPGRTEASLSPVMRTTSPAKNLKICPARIASPMPSGSVLPSSRDNSAPSSSLRAMISLPARSRMLARSWIEPVDHAGNAFFAAATAVRACSASACAYSPITSLVSEGLRFGVAEAPATHSPAM